MAKFRGLALLFFIFVQAHSQDCAGTSATCSGFEDDSNLLLQKSVGAKAIEMVKKGLSKHAVPKEDAKSEVVALREVVAEKTETQSAALREVMAALHEVETVLAKTAPTPKFNAETMPSVSPTVQCVMVLTFQYFVVYTALAIIRTVNQFTNNYLAKTRQVLDAMCITVTYAPMLSILFLATRMRAIQLSKGDTEGHSLPQPWVQKSMYTCTFAVFAQVIMVLLFTAFTDSHAPDEAAAADPLPAEGGRGPLHYIVMVLTPLNYIVMACLYIGAGAVCVGAAMMKAPEDIWGTDGGPQVSPALQCTMILTWIFFAVYLTYSICSMIPRLCGSKTPEFVQKLEFLFGTARLSVNFAPMLSVLFVAARMRALRIDPENGSPQHWAQMFFYACAMAVLVQASAIVFLPLIDSKARIEKGAFEGQIHFHFENIVLKTVGNLIKYGAVLCIYGGAIAVICSIYTIESTDPAVPTPPVSSAVKCVILLTTMYFVALTLVFVIHTVGEFVFSPDGLVATLKGIFEAGQETVMFAPMLCMLFVAAQMRATQLTVTASGESLEDAGPQDWVCMAMFMCVGAMFAQLMMTYIAVAIAGPGAAPSVTNVDQKTSSGPLLLTLSADVVKYVSMLAMYGGVVMVMGGIIVMTPETLPPYAA